MANTSNRIVSAESSKKSARILNYGNIASMLLPFPLFIFWFGASMFVYAMHRHHPNPRVGYYTQRAAYIFYGFSGLLIPLITFVSVDILKQYWWLLWLISALILIPISIREIIRINKDHWYDTEIKD